jgi:hypothetical protein
MSEYSSLTQRLMELSELKGSYDERQRILKYLNSEKIRLDKIGHILRKRGKDGYDLAVFRQRITLLNYIIRDIGNGRDHVG